MGGKKGAGGGGGRIGKREKRGVEGTKGGRRGRGGGTEMGGKKGAGGERIGKREKRGVRWREQKEGEGDGRGGGGEKGEWVERGMEGWERGGSGGMRRSPFPPCAVALHSVQIPWWKLICHKK